jgi:putative tricarboxylic transport membrane protein
MRAGEVALSLGLVLLGAFVVFETGSIADVSGYAGIGPRLFPYVIGAGLATCGAVLGWQALTAGWRSAPGEEAHPAPDRAAFIVISGAIVLHMVLIGWAGFVIASTLLFALVARGYGSARPVRDVLIGAALATVAFLVFTAGLGLNLPKGPFGG